MRQRKKSKKEVMDSVDKLAKKYVSSLFGGGGAPTSGKGGGGGKKAAAATTAIAKADMKRWFE